MMMPIQENAMLEAEETGGMESREATPVSSNRAIHGSFKIADTEFALSADTIQEVVNEPDAYSPIPLSPDYLLGVFNLRGAIVPVIDLRILFSIGPSDVDVRDSRKVAIVEHGDLCLGLLFDSTGEVFNGNEREKCLFNNRGETGKDQVIAGVFKVQNGQRIIQILDVHGMLNLEKVPHSQKSSGHQSNKNRGPRRQCISFGIGQSCCALGIDVIREIVNIGNIENKVLASELCLGAIDIRGDTVPIVNFSKLLGYASSVPDTLSELDSQRVIVMNVADNLVGLLVDSIENIISYFDDELVDFPVLVDKKKTMFIGCVPAKSKNDHTIVLRHSEILSSDELSEITRGHSQLFSESKEESNKNKKNKNDRRTLLTFSLDDRYALDINEVQEVIDYPENLIKAPNMAEFISGMANVRGELVAVIDTRKLYSLSQADTVDKGKLLIYEASGSKYGLAVDSVDSIVHYCSADVINIPEIATRGIQGDIDNDVKDAIMINDGTAKETICILDVDAVSKRAAALGTVDAA